jgi:hypothetical protein
MLLIAAKPQSSTIILWQYRSQDRQYVKLEQAASVENTEMCKELFTELLKDFYDGRQIQ